MYRKIKTIAPAGDMHMVGDGFRTRNFIDRRHWHELSPFLVADYNEPWQLMPTDHPRGVGVHPHKGFETVTIAWEGHIAHEDSSGGKGEIGPGDVQWMTAGSGILHKEFHAESFSKRGGNLHMMQLWVNLPAAAKNTPPSYQDIAAASIPQVELPDNGGTIRVIAGAYGGEKGPAKTFTRMQMLDIRLNAGATSRFNMQDDDNSMLLVLSGNIMVNDEKQVRSGQLVSFENGTGAISIESNNEAHLLLLSGEAIDEPIASYGPFVMNTQEEIRQALADFQAGKFGSLN